MPDTPRRRLRTNNRTLETKESRAHGSRPHRRRLQKAREASRTRSNRTHVCKESKVHTVWEDVTCDAKRLGERATGSETAGQRLAGGGTEVKRGRGRNQSAGRAHTRTQIIKCQRAGETHTHTCVERERQPRYRRAQKRQGDALRARTDGRTRADHPRGRENADGRGYKERRRRRMEREEGEGEEADSTAAA